MNIMDRFKLFVSHNVARELLQWDTEPIASPRKA